MRISDWSSDVCSSDLSENGPAHGAHSADDDVEDDGDYKHRRGKLVRVDEDHVAGIEGREHTGEYGAEHHRRSLVPEQVDPKRRCRSLIIANSLEVVAELRPRTPAAAREHHEGQRQGGPQSLERKR